MRLRTVLFVVATALVVLFALLNWAEISRPTPLNLGWTQVNAPLGLILLGLLALATLGFLASGAIQRTRHVQQEREQAKALQDQRDLADRAEASRFIDLRKTLDDYRRETRDHEKTAAAEREQWVTRSQRELRGLLDQMHRSLTAYLGEMEARLDARIDAQADTRVDTRADTHALVIERDVRREPETRVGDPSSASRVHQVPESTARNT